MWEAKRGTKGTNVIPKFNRDINVPRTLHVPKNARETRYSLLVAQDYKREGG